MYSKNDIPDDIKRKMINNVMESIEWEDILKFERDFLKYSNIKIGGFFSTAEDMLYYLLYKSDDEVDKLTNGNFCVTWNDGIVLLEYIGYSETIKYDNTESDYENFVDFIGKIDFEKIRDIMEFFNHEWHVKHDEVWEFAIPDYKDLYSTIKSMYFALNNNYLITTGGLILKKFKMENIENNPIGISLNYIITDADDDYEYHLEDKDNAD